MGRNTVFIASGDLSHKVSKKGPYGFAPEGVAFDKEITEAMATGDFMRILTVSSEVSEKAAEGVKILMIYTGSP